MKIIGCYCRRGNCKNVSLGLDCEVGLRKRTYNVLSGSVLSVWSRVENILAAKTGHSSKMQVIRLKTAEGLKIVGKLIFMYSVVEYRLESRNEYVNVFIFSTLKLIYGKVLINLPIKK